MQASAEHGVQRDGKLEEDLFWLPQPRVAAGLFSWVAPVMRHAWKHYLEEHDVPAMEPDADAYACAEELNSELNSHSRSTLLRAIARVHARSFLRVTITIWRLVWMLGYYGNIAVIERLVHVVTYAEIGAVSWADMVLVPVAMGALVLLQTVCKNNFYYRAYAVGAQVRVCCCGPDQCRGGVGAFDVVVF